uniref:LITAF domain-containing protein n=1 Tax=Timema genevievae TaxID=629358 RepID=A0A7R9K8S1_TIMGE|nr:unnamed protein product [Timema genevievae]
MEKGMNQPGYPPQGPPPAYGMNPPPVMMQPPPPGTVVYVNAQSRGAFGLPAHQQWSGQGHQRPHYIGPSVGVAPAAGQSISMYIPLVLLLVGGAAMDSCRLVSINAHIISSEPYQEGLYQQPPPPQCRGEYLIGKDDSLYLTDYTMALSYKLHHSGTKQVIVGGATGLGPNPSNIQCPSCHHSVQTRVEHENATKTHLFALLLCLIG